MASKNFMSSILDELMGRNRDVLPTEAPKQVHWDDPEICPYYLVSLCPHDLFVNTKADLGACPKFHDEIIKTKYLEEASNFRKAQMENEFIRFADKMIGDIESKIKRGRVRIALANGQDGGAYGGSGGNKNAEKIALLTERINVLLEEAEAAGCSGDVEKAQGLMKLCDQIKEERESLKSTEVAQAWNPDKAMQVCEVCGSYLIIGEAQHRLDDHIMGKQHMGFALLRKNLEDIKKICEKREEEEKIKLEAEREERRKRRAENSSPKSKSSREKDDKKSEKERKSEREKDRDRDKDRKRDRSRDRDRKRKRSRSRSRSPKDKKRDHKDKERRKERSRSRERRDRDEKSSRRGSSRRSRSRDKNSSKNNSSGERRRSRSRDKKRDKHYSSNSHRDKERDKDKESKKDSHRHHHHHSSKDSSRKHRDESKSPKKEEESPSKNEENLKVGEDNDNESVDKIPKVAVESEAHEMETGENLNLEKNGETGQEFGTNFENLEENEKNDEEEDEAVGPPGED